MKKLTKKETSALEAIAKKELRVATLETRMSDRLDFHEVSVWGIKDALEAAYRLGQESSKK